MTVAGSVALLGVVAALLSSVPGDSGQQKPFGRHFTEHAEEKYQVTLSVKAESHSVTTETIASETYVTPAMHSAEVSLRWRSTRRVLAVHPDGSAEIEEVIGPTGPQCAATPKSSSKADQALEASLKDFCTAWSIKETTRYFEDNRGLWHEENPSRLPPLGETAPALLAWWLRRAVRPSVIFPSLPLEIGAKSRQSLQPASAALQNAHGSETAEWLDAQGEIPAATLHVVQQLSWNSPGTQAKAATVAKSLPADRDEIFFADSLTTLSLLDGSVLHAGRTASRTTGLPVEAVPGLPRQPDFSSKLTLSISIERLP
jgi:hypothetical protein